MQPPVAHIPRRLGGQNSTLPAILGPDGREACPMTLGENIARLRAEKRLSQGDLADALGVSRQSVSKWETEVSHS